MDDNGVNANAPVVATAAAKTEEAVKTVNFMMVYINCWLRVVLVCVCVCVCVFWERAVVDDDEDDDICDPLSREREFDDLLTSD